MLAASPSPKKVAIIIAGTLQRFQFTSSLEHLLQPLRAQGHEVDYYLSLTTAFAKAYRSDMEYMQRITFDPLFWRNESSSSSSTTTTTPQAPPANGPDLDYVRSILRRSIVQSGGHLRHLLLRDHIDIDQDKTLRKKRAQALLKHPTEPADLRFPLLDLRNDIVKQRTTQGNQNILRLMLAIYELWKVLLQVEKTLDFQYDYVLFLRDDTLWLEDFDLDRLLSLQPPPPPPSAAADESQPQKPTPGVVDAFALSCDARDPPMHDREMNDHGIVAARSKAHVFGAYYSEMFKANLDDCMAKMVEASSSSLLSTTATKSSTISSSSSSSSQRRSLPKTAPVRGCNSEMMLRWIVEHHQLIVQKVGQADLPFQRSLNVLLPDGNVGQCFHKLCQSHDNPLDAHGLQKCTALKF